jgi:hypothetical protein
MFRRLLLPIGLVVALPAAASDGPFRPVATPVEAARLSSTTIRAATFHPFFFDARLFAEAVRGVAVEKPSEVGTPSTLLELPHPDGGLALFRVVESPVMAPGLASKFPEIRTFRGEGVDDPTASVRFDVSPPPRLLGHGPLPVRGLVRRSLGAGQSRGRRLLPPA